MPATSTNMFGSVFGSNNAPLPIPGGYGGGGKPTGMTGATNTLPGVTPYNSPAYNSPTYAATNLQGLSSGISGPGTGVNSQALLKELTNAYGKGTGDLIAQILGHGLFNPSVASAFLNAQQPGIARGENDVLNAFGGAGARYSSAASLGLGDYLSEVQLNQQQTLASLYEQSQSQELNLLSGVLPTLHQEQADKGGWVDDLVGGLEIAGGVALTATGIGGLAGIPLIAGGAGTLSKGLDKSSGGTSSTPSIQGLLGGMQQTNTSGIPGISTPSSTSTSGPFAPGGEADQMDQLILQENAGSDLGGIAPTGDGIPGDASNQSMQLQQLLQLLQQQQQGMVN